MGYDKNSKGDNRHAARAAKRRIAKTDREDAATPPPGFVGNLYAEVTLPPEDAALLQRLRYSIRDIIDLDLDAQFRRFSKDASGNFVKEYSDVIAREYVRVGMEKMATFAFFTEAGIPAENIQCSYGVMPDVKNLADLLKELEELHVKKGRIPKNDPINISLSQDQLDQIRAFYGALQRRLKNAISASR